MFLLHFSFFWVSIYFHHFFPFFLIHSRFPDVRKKPALWKRWVKALARQNWTPSHYTYICSQHFEKSCFQEVKPGGRALLHRYAVPTIFKTGPAMQRSSSQTDRHLAFTYTSLSQNASEFLKKNFFCSLTLRLFLFEMFVMQFYYFGKLS